MAEVPVAAPDAVVLVAHGSRSPAGREEMEALAASVARARPGVEVRLGYLELCDPPAAAVIDDVLSAGASCVAVTPLMLHAAGHSKSDVPAVVAAARAHHPGARLVYARPLGADHTLLTLARARLAEAGGCGLPLAVLARGSSDPDANAEAYRVSRLLADMCATSVVATGFSGVTWPSVPEALEQLRRLGAEQVAAFAWFIATGLLVDRMQEDFGRFSDRTGVPVVFAGHLGVGPGVVSLVLERVDEAMAGQAVPNCDACAYRRPFPGLEERVGLPIGVGHSHLASDHLHQAHRHHH
ncbi:MAG TPA: sirohydrochlorin chelatase [Acidimicrobiales bacterium]|nr:sirohydrochlorin chelatase [Acidimicrobiales bacterium]